MSAPSSAQMPESTAAMVRAAVEAVQAASTAAAHAAAQALIEATGGRGQIHRAWSGEGPDAWCRVTAGHLSASILKSRPGNRAHCQLISVTPEGYELIRAYAEAEDTCFHDDECDCLEAPWPTLAELVADDAEFEIDYRGGTERGTARHAFNRITLTLFDEPVSTLYPMIRLSRRTS